MTKTNWFRRLAFLTLGLLATIVTVATQAQTRELRYAIGFAPGSIIDKAAQEYARTAQQASGGRLTVKVYPMSLLNIAETSGGLREGIADIGAVLTPYFASEYPHTNLISEASMMLRLTGDQVRGREGKAFVGAISEFVMLHCPECNQEFSRQNQVYTGHIGGSSFGLICTKAVRTVADMKGKRFRVGAANWSRWVNSMGGTPVTMSANEMLEALKQGVVDCIVLSSPEIRNFGLTETVTDITMAVPGGIFTTAMNVNASTWKSLDAEQRRALLHASAAMGAAVPTTYHQNEDDILASMRKRGARLHDADPELVRRTLSFIEQDTRSIADYFANKHGVKRGEAMLKTFRPLLDKWASLVQGADTAEKLTELYWREIYAKVDVGNHGR